MLRRAAICVMLAAFVAGLGGQVSAETLPLVRHRTKIVITQITAIQDGFRLEGDLRSGYQPCTQRRLVGLFLGDQQIGPVVRSRSDGTFTLDHPGGSGDFEIVAFKHARDCNHLCRTARLGISIEPGVN